jgi:hypothetical protein
VRKGVSNVLISCVKKYKIGATDKDGGPCTGLAEFPAKLVVLKNVKSLDIFDPALKAMNNVEPSFMWKRCLVDAKVYILF